MKEIFGFVVRCPYEVGCSAQNCRYCKVYENHIKRAFQQYKTPKANAKSMHFD